MAQHLNGVDIKILDSKRGLSEPPRTPPCLYGPDSGGDHACVNRKEHVYTTTKDLKLTLVIFGPPKFAKVITKCQMWNQTYTNAQMYNFQATY